VKAIFKYFRFSVVYLVATLLPTSVRAGAQQYEPLAASVQAALHSAIADRASSEPQFPSIQEKLDWLTEMSSRLTRHMPDREARLEFLKTVYYEAKRAGLDPQLVLGLIEVASGFKKYSISPAGERGYMQVMPFWVGLIGDQDSNLFHLGTNLRFGCTILRHYLDIENGDLSRALARYKGGIGQSEFPKLVRNAWETHWSWGTPAVGAPNEIQQAAATLRSPYESGLIEIPIKDSRGCKTLVWSKEGSKSANPTLKWDGKCKNGYLHGKGKATLTFDWGTMTTKANFVGGREEGYGVVSKNYGNGDTEFSKGNFYHGRHEGYVEANTTKKSSYTSTFKGNYHGGRHEGYGELVVTMSSGEIISYKGNFQRGKLDGKGWKIFGDGSTYEGSFSADSIDGLGKYCWANGVCLESQFTNGDHGRTGKLLYADGQVYQGELENYAPHGKGSLSNPATGQSYRGYFIKGLMDGQGVFENAGMRFQVATKDGKIVESSLILPNGQTVPIRADDVHPLTCEAFGSVVGTTDHVKCKDLLMATAVLRDEVESKKRQIAEYERLGKEIKAMMDEQNSRSRSEALLNYANETLKPTVLSPAPASPPIQKGTLQSNTRNCPAGSSPWIDEWGNKICKRLDSGQTTTVQGSLKNCPTGSSPWTDEWGNRVCKDFANNKQYYDTSKGCPTGTHPWTDSWGNRVCTSN